MTARMAEPLRRLFASQFLEPGDSEAELGLRFAEKAEALLPLLTADLDYLLRMHLADDLRNEALGMAERDDRRAARLLRGGGRVRGHRRLHARSARSCPSPS